MKRIALLTALALAGCSNEAARPAAAPVTVTVADALCRPTPTGRQMTACYLTLTASGDDRLLSVASPLAARVEIHESRIESGMMMMNEMVGGLPLAPGARAELKPGGSHIMVMGLSAPLAAGDTVPLTLTFATAEPVEVVATVSQPPVPVGGAPAPH